MTFLARPGSGPIVITASGLQLLSPWTGFAVVAGEVAVLLLAALLLYRRRDA